MRPVRYCGWSEPFETLYRQPVEIVGERYTVDRPNGYTIFRCPVCDSWFACSEQEIDEIIRPILIEHKFKYEANRLLTNKNCKELSDLTFTAVVARGFSSGAIYPTLEEEDDE